MVSGVLCQVNLEGGEHFLPDDDSSQTHIVMIEFLSIDEDGETVAGIVHQIYFDLLQNIHQ